MGRVHPRARLSSVDLAFVSMNALVVWHTPILTVPRMMAAAPRSMAAIGIIECIVLSRHPKFGKGAALNG
jgi:hypothetical protein